MKVIIFSSSLRQESLNTKLINLVYSKIHAKNNLVVKFIDLNKHSIPLYNGDIEKDGFPQGIIELAQEIQSANALIISSPEYNHGISGVFKNTIDWLSRVRPMPLNNKSLLLMSASPGGFGGIRGLEQAKPLLVSLGMLFYSKDFSLPYADKAFKDNGDFIDDKNDKYFGQIINSFLEFAQKNAIIFS